MARVGAEDTAFGDRSSEFMLSIDSTWDDPADDEVNIDWTRAYWRDAHRFSQQGKIYFNFPGLLEEGDSAVRASYGANHERLTRVKAQYDPEQPLPAQPEHPPGTRGAGMTAYAVAPSPLWRLAASRGAPQLAAAGLLGRIAMGMIPLALILAVAAHVGSYAAAGAITASYALGVALGGPLRGRLADRLGARPVLLVTGSLHAVALVGCAGLIQLGVLGAPLALGGFLIGATLPPTGSVMRTIWDRTLEDEELRRTAMAIESVALDIGLLTGPLLVAGIALIAPAEMALPAAAMLTVISCVSLAAAPGRAHPRRLGAA